MLDRPIGICKESKDAEAVTVLLKSAGTQGLERWLEHIHCFCRRPELISKHPYQAAHNHL